MTFIFLISIVEKLKAKLHWQYEEYMNVSRGWCEGMLNLFFNMT